MAAPPPTPPVGHGGLLGEPGSPSDEARSQKRVGGRPQYSLVHNTVAQSGPVILGFLLSFISAPIVVSGLGLRMFGIWALTGALAQYGGLLDLGVGRSLSRFVAAHQSDRRACGEYIALGFVAVVVVGVVLLAGAIAVAPLLAKNLGGISSSHMRLVLVSSVVLLVCTMVTLVVAAYPVGLRRMVTPNIGIAAGAVVNFIASVTAIAAGADLADYAMANAGAGLVTVVIVTVLVVRSEGMLPFSRPRHHRTSEFLRFGIKLQLSWAMELVNYQSDKIVIALSVGPAAAGSYELANRVAAAGRQIGILPSTALLPTLTADLSVRGMDYLRGVYQRLTETIVSVAFPFLALIAALSPLLLGAWLGHLPANAEVVLPALAIPYLASVSSDMAKVVASAAGDPGVVAKTAVGTAIANLALTAALAPFFGLWGVLAGTVAALSCGAMVQVAVVHRRFELPRGSFAGAVLPTLRISALLAAPVFVVAYSHVLHGRGAQAAAVILLTLGYLSVYAWLSARAGRLPRRVLARVAPLRRFLVVQ